MNKLLKNIITSGVIITGLSLFPSTVNAELVYSELGSVLCYNENRDTKIAVSIKGFNAAICSVKDNNSYYLYYYVGQDKKANKKIVIPVKEADEIGDALVFKAVNGSYTYQVVATCHPGKQKYDYATLSVFEKGKRVRYHRANKYMTNQPWCMDTFGQSDTPWKYRR